MSSSTSLPLTIAIVGFTTCFAVLVKKLRHGTDARRRDGGDSGSSADGSSDPGFWSWFGGDSDCGGDGGGDGGGD